MAGRDQLYGGSGPDLLIGDVDSRYFYDNDGNRIEQGLPEIAHGHFGNIRQADSLDDAVDILLIQGDATFADRTSSINHDRDAIVVRDARGGEDPNLLFVSCSGYAETDSGLLETFPRDFRIQWRPDPRTSTAPPYVEQIHVAGLMGDDRIVTDISGTTLDYVRNLLEDDPTGGPGDDLITGTAGRDHIFGGPGSDMLFGLAGDDRLWGDYFDGGVDDTDYLFAGAGNDDLIGGSGSNRLYAWSFHPHAAVAFPPAGDSFLADVRRFLDEQRSVADRETSTGSCPTPCTAALCLIFCTATEETTIVTSRGTVMSSLIPMSRKMTHGRRMLGRKQMQCGIWRPRPAVIRCMWTTSPIRAPRFTTSTQSRCALPAPSTPGLGFPLQIRWLSETARVLRKPVSKQFTGTAVLCSTFAVSRMTVT